MIPRKSIVNGTSHYQSGIMLHGIGLSAAPYFSAQQNSQAAIQRMAASMSGTDDVPHGSNVADFTLAGALNGISVLLSLLPGAGKA